MVSLAQGRVECHGGLWDWGGRECSSTRCLRLRSGFPVRSLEKWSAMGGRPARLACRRFRGAAYCVAQPSPDRTLDCDERDSVPSPEWKMSSDIPVSVSSSLKVVADDLQIMNNNLLSMVGSENPVLKSAAEQIFSAEGMRLIPALVFLVSRATAKLAGMEDITPEHRRLAEIMEIILTGGLIHDDVLDGSGMRKGKETIHQLFGTRVAVLAGDFMLAQSICHLVNIGNLEVTKLMSQAIKDFASGEIKQAFSLFNCDITLEEYLTKSYHKAASFVAASAKGAAILSGVGTPVCEKMYEYGKNLGLAFQVLDDILDFTQSAEKLGEPAASDLAEGNLTGPVIFALEKEPQLRDIIDSKFSKPGSLKEAIELVFRGGGIDKAFDLAREKGDLAIQNLQCLPESEFRLSLEKMATFNIEDLPPL